MWTGGLAAASLAALLWAALLGASPPPAPAAWPARIGSSCPAPPAPPPEPLAPPSSLPEPRLPTPAGTLLEGEGWQEVPLGVGRLRPEAEPFVATEWLSGVILPLYALPGGPLQGWLARGWSLDPSGARRAPLDTAGMVETGREEASLVVLETCPDGWFRIRFAQPGSQGDGTAWAHRSHLALGETPLAMQPWEELFLATGLLFFRSEVPHALRAEPDGELLEWIARDHELEPLEFRGDWARVRAVQPARTCLPPGEWRGRVAEGWVRWWSPGKGPWLWYPTRGC